MPSYEPNFQTPFSRRWYVNRNVLIKGLFTYSRSHSLLNLYGRLHAQLHTKPTHLKIYHATSAYSISLAWSTPLFELYAIAPSTTPRTALAQAANKLIQWVRREEDRVFIIGGATF